jgi:DNA-binding LacI/PurR family transcriptional regulator
VERQIRELLESGTYAPGDFLPPERLLSERFNVSRPTLRAALLPLLEGGLLVNHPGVGTRVKAVGKDRNPKARSWRVIGLLLPDFENPFFVEITEAIEYTALQRGYQVLLSTSRHQPAIEESHLKQFAEHRVDGAILAHDPQNPFPKSAERLREAEIPYVALFSSPTPSECDSVVLDEYAGVEQAMRYLYSLGHRRIAMCRVVPGDSPHPREQAFLKFMDRAGLAVPKRFMISQEALTESDGNRTVEELFRESDAPTAIFSGNDRNALIALRHLRNYGLQIPEDVSLVGFDNLRLTDHLEVPLTTVDQPKQAMGRRALELLLERIEFGVTSAPVTDVFQSHLVVRESCAIAKERAVPALTSAVK